MPEPAEIRTRRLLLRRPRPADAESFVEVHTRPETHAHSGFGRRTREQALELLALIQRDWQDTGIGYWTVLTAGAGEPIGFGGLRHADDEGAPILNLYFRFQPFAWGNGYATEMSAAAVDWAQHNRPDIPVLVRTAARTLPRSAWPTSSASSWFGNGCTKASRKRCTAPLTRRCGEDGNLPAAPGGQDPTMVT